MARREERRAQWASAKPRRLTERTPRLRTQPPAFEATQEDAAAGVWGQANNPRMRGSLT